MGRKSKLKGNRPHKKRSEAPVKSEEAPAEEAPVIAEVAEEALVFGVYSSIIGKNPFGEEGEYLPLYVAVSAEEGIPYYTSKIPRSPKPPKKPPSSLYPQLFPIENLKDFWSLTDSKKKQELLTLNLGDFLVFVEEIKPFMGNSFDKALTRVLGGGTWSHIPCPICDEEFDNLHEFFYHSKSSHEYLDVSGMDIDGRSLETPRDSQMNVPWLHILGESLSIQFSELSPDRSVLISQPSEETIFKWLGAELSLRESLSSWFQYEECRQAELKVILDRLDKGLVGIKLLHALRASLGIRGGALVVFQALFIQKNEGLIGSGSEAGLKSRLDSSEDALEQLYESFLNSSQKPKSMLNVMVDFINEFNYSQPPTEMEAAQYEISLRLLPSYTEDKTLFKAFAEEKRSQLIQLNDCDGKIVRESDCVREHTLSLRAHIKRNYRGLFIPLLRAYLQSKISSACMLLQFVSDDVSHARVFETTDIGRSIVGRPVIVIMISGVYYKGILVSVDGCMNILMKNTVEIVNGQVERSYSVVFIAWKNVYGITWSKSVQDQRLGTERAS